jgi:signal transduction histidine kinase
MASEAPVACPHCRASGTRAQGVCPSCSRPLSVARIEICSGPLRGRQVPVFLAPFTIGRAPDNDLSLPDLAVSRLHARIVPDGDGLAVQDLESRFGVYLDGSRVQKAALRDASRLKIGDTLLHVALHGAAPDPEAPTDPGISSAIKTAPREDLLLAVVEALGSTLVVSEVLEHVIDGILNVTRAERGFLLLTDPGKQDVALPRVAGLTVRVARQTGRGTSSGTFGISSSIVKKVITTGSLLVTGNASRDPSLNPAESVMNLGLKTIVCLPLRVTRANGESPLLGVIYADNQTHSTAFSDESLKAAEALARHAALAIHNAQLYESEQRASQAKSAFLGAMSHELHTPLNAIIGYGEMIEERARERSDPDDADDARRILDAGQHLLRLVDEVLDMSQLEAGHLKLSCEAVELVPALREPVGNARRKAAERKLHFESTIPVGLRVVAEPRRLVQVVGKLLDNAIAFTKKGTVSIVVQPVEVDPAWVDIAVQDEGQGMSPEQVVRVLEPFTQLDDSTTRSHGGMGLGLPLSLRLCEAMGGGLRITTAPGKGTTVTVRLPTAST